MRHELESIQGKTRCATGLKMLRILILSKPPFINRWPVNRRPGIIRNYNAIHIHLPALASARPSVGSPYTCVASLQFQ